jgi:ABC-type oligopeptide transport system substrate-binding subunit
VGVRALDDLTLEVRLQRPASYFLHLLSHGAAYPVPRHAVRAHGERWTEPGNIVTNGPFTIEAWHGDSMVLARRPGYHGHFTGNLRRVQLSLLATADRARALAMYENDELEVFPMDDVPGLSRARVREALPEEYVLVPSAATFYITFDVTRPPFDDVRVRRSFAHALDRTALVNNVLGDTDVAAMGGLVPQGMPGHTPGIGLPYDPQRARQLLAQAGYPGGEGFPSLQLLSWPRRDEQLRYLLAQWHEELGVELSVDRILEWGEYLETVLSRAPSLFLMGWVPDYPDPDSFLRVPIRDQSAWRHPTYDQLIGRALEVTDQRQRMQLYSQADRILMQEAPIVPLSYSQTPLLIKPWVKEYPFHAFTYWAWKHVVMEPH